MSVSPTRTLHHRHCSAEAHASHSLAPGAEFRCLSGDEEARAELRATQHVASLALPPDAPRPICMLSGGGMTCQLAHYPDGPAGEPRFLSVVAGLNPATKHMRQADDAKASLAAFQASLAAQVEATGCKGAVGGGTFVVIEMPGGLGSGTDYDGAFARLASRIGRQLLSKEDVADALREHLEAWARATPGGLPADVPNAYIATLPAELLELLELFDSRSARLYVSREWPAAKAKGAAARDVDEEPIKPDWSLGVFLERREGTYVT